MASLPARAEVLRIATWNVGFERDGPGLLLRDLLRGDDPQVGAALRVIGALDADVILLTGMDYDAGHQALSALQAALAATGAAYPHGFALRPNTGVATDLDIDGDGLRRGPRDAQGWGPFAGAAGMAILSRLPVDQSGVVDHSAFLWRDLPDTLSPDPPDGPLAAVQRLSTTGHWQVPVLLPDGRALTLLAWSATPPVFDGPEDRNGRRNHDEAAFWHLLLDGRLDSPPPTRPFVLLGDAQLDPVDSNGLAGAMRRILSHPAIHDPEPRGTHGRQEPDQAGDPALDTVLYRFGGLRVGYVLPSADLGLVAAGVMWPPEGDALWPDLAAASRHRPVWVDVVIPPDGRAPVPSTGATP